MRPNEAVVGRMRIQLQQSHSGSTPNTYSIVVDATTEVGVTVRQLRDALHDLYKTVPEQAPWFQFNNYESELVQAIVRLSERAARYLPWGVDGDLQNIDREPWDAQRGMTYRVDLENIRGVNLQVLIDDMDEEENN